MRFFSILTIFLGAVAASPMPDDEPVVEDRAVAPKKVEIKSFNYGGPGCRQGTAGGSISEDKEILNLMYDAMEVSVPDGKRRTWCQLNVELDFPQGYSFSIVKNDYRGYCEIDRGLKAEHKATYYFSGFNGQVSTKKTIKGPHEGDYLVEDKIGVGALVWSPCGHSAMLNIKQAISISKPRRRGQEGTMDLASSDHRVSTEFHIQWRKCPGN